MQRLTWESICCSEQYVGRWVALSDCAYDESGKASEGRVVDTDADLVELCARLGDDAQTNCDIVFCSKRDHDRASRPSTITERRSSFPPGTGSPPPTGWNRTALRR